MKVIIPAAGRGTRLKPLTDTEPKILIHVGGKPMIKHIFDILDDINRIIGPTGKSIDEIV